MTLIRLNAWGIACGDARDYCGAFWLHIGTLLILFKGKESK